MKDKTIQIRFEKYNYLEELLQNKQNGIEFILHDEDAKECGAETIFIAGKGIQSGVTIPYMRLIDEGPTIARLLGLHLGETDGSIVEDLLNCKELCIYVKVM